MSEVTTVLLDNGSLRPESTLSLRQIAAGLGERLGQRVHPVSLLHSSKVDPAELAGEEALTWRRFLRRGIEAGRREFRVVPLFFGPSSAFVDYLPKVSQEVRERYGEAVVEVAAPLLDPKAPERRDVAIALVELLIQNLDTDTRSDASTGVIVVDHGSPLPTVAAARDRVAAQVGELLADRGWPVMAASMERREGAEYAFNEPLLATALQQAKDAGWRRVLLSYLFFSPGRHAGPGGDIDQIVSESRFVREGGEVLSAPLFGTSPRLPDLLAARYRERFEPT